MIGMIRLCLFSNQTTVESNMHIYIEAAWWGEGGIAACIGGLIIANIIKNMQIKREKTHNGAKKQASIETSLCISATFSNNSLTVSN